MIRTSEIISAKIKAGGSRVSHHVKVVITGKRDLERLAASVERNGNKVLADVIRTSKRFETSMSPETFKSLSL